MELTALTKKEVSDVIHGRKKAPRVPVALHFWTHAEDFPDPEKVREITNRYPEDVEIISLRIPDATQAPPDDPSYRWINAAYQLDENAGLDERGALSDWGMLDEVLAKFPSPDYPGLIPQAPAPDGRDRIAHWWYCLFERHWQLRGMTNALTDYYEYPDEVHRLFRAVTDFYLRMIERARLELGADAILTSDDIGTQNSQFFSQAIFDEFYKPYYQEISDKIHSLQMDFWLHACGCIEKFIPSFLEIGLDVLHPIQKYTMDEQEIVRKFGDKICFWAGFDVQKTIPFGTPEEVREEVRYMNRVFQGENGRYLFTAGNGINRDCPLESLAALYDEAYKQR